MNKSETDLEKLLKSYRDSQPRPSRERLRQSLQSPSRPRIRWQLLAIPAGAIVLILIITPRLRQTKLVTPKLSIVSSADTINNAVSALQEAGFSEQQLASSESPEFDSSASLLPPSTIGDDF